MATMTLTIERVRVFNGLDVLVAKDEGLFAAEGLDLRIAVPAPGDLRPATDGTPQELAHRTVALDYGNGTAYAGLRMLQGTFDVTTQINRRIERDAHARAGLEESAR